MNPALLDQKGIVPLKVYMVCSVCPEATSDQAITYDTDARQSTRAVFSIVADRRLADADGMGSVTFKVFSGGQLLDRLTAPVQVDPPGPAPAPGGRKALLTAAQMSALRDPRDGPDLVVAVRLSENREDVAVGVTAVSDWAKKHLPQQSGRPFVAQQFPNGPRFGEIKQSIVDAFNGLKELMEKDPANRPVLSSMQAQGPKFSGGAADLMTPGELQGTLSVLSELGMPLYGDLFRSTKEIKDLFSQIEGIPRPPGRPLRVQIEARDFQVPWALLRPPSSTSPDDFWGFKYELSVMIIDGVWAASPATNPDGGKLARTLYAGLPKDVSGSLGAMSDEQFASLSKALGSISPRNARTRDDFLAEIRAHHSALELIFAFVHGTDGVPGAKSDVGLALLFKLDDINEALTPRAFSSLRSTLGIAGDAPLFPSHPIVILDACVSGATATDRSTTDPSGGFPHKLLKAGASAVVATDAPVWGKLARAMGDLLITSLVRGDSVPKAVHEARQSLRKSHNNPLGLLYIPYSLPDARFSIGGSKT